MKKIKLLTGLALGVMMTMGLGVPDRAHAHEGARPAIEVIRDAHVSHRNNYFRNFGNHGQRYDKWYDDRHRGQHRGHLSHKHEHRAKHRGMKRHELAHRRWDHRHYQRHDHRHYGGSGISLFLRF